MRDFNKRYALILLSIIFLLTAVLAAQAWASNSDPAAQEGWSQTYFPLIEKTLLGSGSNDAVGGQVDPGDDEEVDTGFEIDGNTKWELVGDYDWDSLEYLTPDWDNLGYPPAVLITDPHSKAGKDTTIFKPNGKFDEPENWKVNSGVVGPPQTELTNLSAWLVAPNDLAEGKPSSPWLIMSMERTKEQGTFYLDFEFNQEPWEDLSGGPVRKEGDLVVGYAIHGNPTDLQKDIQIMILQYLPEQPSLCEVTPGNGQEPAQVVLGDEPCPAYGDSGFYYRFLADGAIMAESGVGEATMNEEPFSPPWTSYDAQGDVRDEIGPFQFAEAAINLEALGIELHCSTWSTVHAKGRASLSVNSDMKDLAGPVPLAVNCRVDGHKFLDVNGNGAWDKDAEPPLANWEIHLNDEKSSTTDNEGYYSFEWLLDGRYTISEVCPDDWVQSAPAFTDFDSCGDATYTVDINIHNHEFNDLDFGNGMPDIEVSKSCTAEVFVGDDIAYEILVDNTGNVDLHNVKIIDPLVGLSETIDVLQAGMSTTVVTTTVASEAGIIVNEVTASGVFAAATVTDTANCETNVYALDVTKSVQTSMTRQYNWAIDKDVSDPSPIQLKPGQNTGVTYSVTVGFDETLPYVDSEWMLQGTITVTNPSPMDATLESITDNLSDGTIIPVSCDSLAVPAMDSLICTYGPVSLNSGESLINTATATLKNNNGNTTDFSGSASVGFDEGHIDGVDDIVVVADSYAGDLGMAKAADAPMTFNYDRTIGPFDDNACGNLPVGNTASYLADDTGANGEAQASVAVQVICTS